jgi:hypothetical protein
MANRNTQGFGLVPAGTLGSTPATSGQGKYKIDAGYGDYYLQWRSCSKFCRLYS